MLQTRGNWRAGLRASASALRGGGGARHAPPPRRRWPLAPVWASREGASPDAAASPLHLLDASPSPSPVASDDDGGAASSAPPSVAERLRRTAPSPKPRLSEADFSDDLHWYGMGGMQAPQAEAPPPPAAAAAAAGGAAPPRPGSRAGLRVQLSPADLAAEEERQYRRAIFGFERCEGARFLCSGRVRAPRWAALWARRAASGRRGASFRPRRAPEAWRGSDPARPPGQTPNPKTSNPNRGGPQVDVPLHAPHPRRPRQPHAARAGGAHVVVWLCRAGRGGLLHVARARLRPAKGARALARPRRRPCAWETRRRGGGAHEGAQRSCAGGGGRRARRRWHGGSAPTPPPPTPRCT
jgi:hypothetical protein